jgi:hypothetical protein
MNFPWRVRKVNNLRVIIFGEFWNDAECDQWQIAYPTEPFRSCLTDFLSRLPYGTMNDFARWSKTVCINLFDDKWESMSKKPGVYVIRASRPIPRIGGKDHAGVLYIGRASSLRNRVWNFMKANHTASGFLWTHLDFAKVMLDDKIRTVSDIEKRLRRLRVRYATPIRKSQVEQAERALLFAYMSRYGEAPPLNLSIPQRWVGKPSPSDLRWAEAGIERAG